MDVALHLIKNRKLSRHTRHCYWLNHHSVVSTDNREQQKALLWAFIMWASFYLSESLSSESSPALARCWHWITVHDGKMRIEEERRERLFNSVTFSILICFFFLHQFLLIISFACSLINTSSTHKSLSRILQPCHGLGVREYCSCGRM